MPKVPSFAVVSTPKGWRVRVPKALSDTGQPQTRFFPARRKAEDFAKKLREQYRSHGEGASVLPPRVADDAFRAWTLLEPIGITLTEAARRAVREHDAATRSVIVSKAISAWLAACNSLRDATLKSYKATGEKLKAVFGERLLSAISAAEIQESITGPSYDLHRRNASAFWHWAAKAPRKWCAVAVFSDVENLSTPSDNEISVLLPALVGLLLRTAEEHFPETVSTYAVGFFGGARVEERKRLTKEEFTEDGIELGKAIAKKRRRRHIPMNDTLSAWLTEYPFSPCPNWAEKDKAVRRLAGWDVKARILKDPPKPTLGRWPRNVIRHTHASAEIANGASLEDLLFRFGHTDSPEMLRSHYVGRYTKKQAVAFWSIGPRGSTIPLLKTA